MEIGRSASYGNDLLGLLLAETEKKYKKGESDDGFCFTTQHLMDECKTFFFTGHETTALLLTWTIMLLASNPGWQERAKAEVEQVCGGSAPAVDHLPKLSLVIIPTLFSLSNNNISCWPVWVMVTATT
ncbi:hypothetical protein AMTR_s00156p00087030 [Amborella trichopoda]|uniref:Cytochrome P450 n=1 Tax=Amborella trichopoda TaxID=13333 RepID=W1PKX4_AMBTC|nr:hypothetical protein AMTR_s00156p00087030 [Amborella trichopoda]